MEQAGETESISSKQQRANKPKGLFPIYIPSHSSYFGIYPFSSTEIHLPDDTDKLQVEVELALLFDVIFKKGLVANLVPKAFTVFNDFSKRNKSEKLSERKNWGTKCKGISNNWIELESFAPGSALDRFHLVSFLQRNGTCIKYTQDVGVANYLYFHKRLVSWLIETINQQQNESIFERILPLVSQHPHRKNLLVAVGGALYTEFGENNYIKAGDRVQIFLYGSGAVSLKEIEDMLAADDYEPSEYLLVLTQIFRKI